MTLDHTAQHLISFLTLWQFPQLPVLRLLPYQMRLRMLPALTLHSRCKDYLRNFTVRVFSTELAHTGSDQ